MKEIYETSFDNLNIASQRFEVVKILDSSQMKQFDSWIKNPIQHKEKILDFEFLATKEYITELEDEYFYLNVPIEDVESEYYKGMNAEMMEAFNIKDPEMEIKSYIKDIGKYNGIKDITQQLIGKLADCENISIKEMEKRIEIAIEGNDAL